MDQEHLTEFKEFLEKTKGLSKQTVHLYCYWIRDLDVSNLTQESINQFIQDKGNNSIIRGALMSFFEMTGLNRTFEMPPKRTGAVKQRIIRDISNNEIDTLRMHLYSKSFRKGLIFDLLYQGALRRAEVPTIKLNSFKWLEWIENVNDFCKLIIKGKRDKERIVLINPETAERIFNHYNRKYNFENMEQITTFANSPSLLFTIDGKQISEWYVWNVVHTGSHQILSRDIRTHELRHCRATELEKMGVPIRDIKNYLGHSSLATTEIYLHRSEKESIENIGNILKKEQESIA
jgi:site-specific recombinase XerD